LLPERQLLLVTACFALYGFVNGVWLVLLADLKVALALTKGQFGLALTLGGIGSVPIMLAAGKVSDRIGPFYVIATGSVVVGIVLLAMSNVSSFLLFVILVIGYLSATGAFNVGINAAAITIEQSSGRNLLAYIHSAYSAFAAIGALVVGALFSQNVSFRTILLVVGFGACLFAIGAFLNRDGVQTQSQPVATDGGTKSWQTLRNPVILLVAAVVWIGFLAEGAFQNWSTIYLRTALDVPASLGASGLVVFQTAMTGGRLGGGRLTEYVGSRRVLQLAGVAATTGMILALVTQYLPLVLAGFILLGLSISVVNPTGQSLAGKHANGRTGEASSVVSTIGFTATLVGPVLIGTLADVASLRLALGVIVVAGAVLLLLSTRLPRPSGRSDPTTADTEHATT
jgi:MFS family permease